MKNRVTTHFSKFYEVGEPFTADSALRHLLAHVFFDQYNEIFDNRILNNGMPGRIVPG